jgi:predicted transcriptional regulator
MNTVKDDAKKIIENLPEQATWDDLMYQLYVKKKIEKSLKEAAEGNTITHEDVKKRVLGNAN